MYIDFVVDYALRLMFLCWFLLGASLPLFMLWALYRYFKE